MSTTTALTATSPADLIASINTEHRACESAVRKGLAHALRCGGLLAQAKATVPHGTWLPWLADHFDGSDRTAQLYLRLHKHRDEIEAKAQRVADLPVREAAKLLAESQKQLKDQSRHAAARSYYADKITAAWREVEDGQQEIVNRTLEAARFLATAKKELSREKFDQLVADGTPLGKLFDRKAVRQLVAIGQDDRIHALNDLTNQQSQELNEASRAGVSDSIREIMMEATRRKK